MTNLNSEIGFINRRKLYNRILNQTDTYNQIRTSIITAMFLAYYEIGE